MRRISILIASAWFINAFWTISTVAEARGAKSKLARPAPTPLARIGTGYWSMPDDGKSVTYALPFKAVR